MSEGATVPTTSESAKDEAGRRIASRVSALREALEIGGDRLTPAVAARALADLDNVDARLRIGVDRTVVALVGGTGSGKSSLFNAISGLPFAEVGVRRPTTAQAAACTWGGPADALLDLLEVRPERRIQRESSLDGPAESDLAGLVLLDLPDHDSIAPEHARLVDRLLPLVDLLVWVVDPQKYADNALHGRYLRSLVERQDGMLVLVNQVDTVPGGAVGRIASDVTRLLEQDGLHDVPVLATSVATGDGIDEVRALLAQVVAGESMAAWVVDVEISAVADRLAADLGLDLALTAADDGARLASATDAAVRLLAEAAGLDAVGEAIRTAVRSPRRRLPLVRPGSPPPATVEHAREAWVARAAQGLPERWASDLDRAAPSTHAVGEAVDRRLGAVPLPSPDAGVGWRWAAIGAGSLAVAAVVLGVLGEVGPEAFVAGGIAAVVAVICVITGGLARRRAAERRSSAFVGAAREALREAVDGALLPVAARVRGEFGAAGAAVERARLTGMQAPPQRSH